MTVLYSCPYGLDELNHIELLMTNRQISIEFKLITYVIMDASEVHHELHTLMTFAG